MHFFRQIFGGLYFLGYVGLKGSHISKEKKTHSYRARQWHIKHVTCAKIQGLYLKNGVYLDSGPVNCKNHGF